MADLALRAARLVIQSDRRLVREALAAYFDGGRGFTVVGHTATAHGLQTLCALGRPDVALIEVNSVTARMVHSLQELRGAFPGTALVVAYTNLSLDLLTEAVRAGVTSFVPSSRGLDAVLRLLRRRARNARTLTPAVPNGQALTDRELGVISLLSSGHTTSDIARLLRISPHTVDNHKRRVYAKFGVDSQNLAVSRAMALALVPAPPSRAEPSRLGAPGRAPLAVVGGTAGLGMDQVLQVLITRGLPVVHVRAHPDLRRDHWAQWHQGPIITVLVDPTGLDWQLPAGLGTATVVVRFTPPDRAVVTEALAAGARAVVYGDDVGRDLPDLLWLVTRGYLALSADHAVDLARWGAASQSDPLEHMPELTAREQEILALMAGGHTIRQTARALGIAAKTVENTQARLYRKLGTHNRAETIAVAYRLGLLGTDQHPQRLPDIEPDST